MKQTTVNDIRGWLEEGKKAGATHVVVVCDTWDYEEYAKFVMPHHNVNEVIEQTGQQSMQKVMEVYSYAQDIEEQLKQPIAWNI